MKYLKMFNENINKSEIDAICENYNIKNYTINDDGTIDVNGNVDLSNKQLTVLPLKFRIVSGYFDCSDNKLISIEGSPIRVSYFSCSRNKLTSLNGCPQYVGGSFYCMNNKLITLVGAPDYVKESFNCANNNLTNLDGSPKYVGYEFDCSFNNLTTLKGITKKIYGQLSCNNNKLKNVDYLPILKSELIINDNPFEYIFNLLNYNLEVLYEFIDREIIQNDILLINRLIELLDDYGKNITIYDISLNEIKKYYKIK